MDNEKCFPILNKVHKALNSVKAVFFVHAGTLLGMIRENGFIEHDYDIDIGILDWNEDTVFKIQEALTASGFKLHRAFFFRGKLTQEAYLYKSIRIDIFYFFSDFKNSWHYTYYRTQETRYKHMKVVMNIFDKIQGIETLNINNYLINLPKNAIKMIEKQFGANWRTPCKDWIYYKSYNAIQIEELGETLLINE